MWRPGSSGAAIDFTAVPDLDHFNGAACVVDSMNDSELALANGIASRDPSSDQALRSPFQPTA